jgi:hypothetical protein
MVEHATWFKYGFSQIYVDVMFKQIQYYPCNLRIYDVLDMDTIFYVGTLYPSFFSYQ